MLKPSQLSCIVGALLVITGTAAIAAPTYQYRSPAHGLAPAQVQAPPPVVLSSVGDGISKAGACATGAATGCATWGTVNMALKLNNDLSVKMASGSASAGMGSISKTSGKWYWELTQNASSTATAPAWGLISGTATPSGSWIGYITSLWVDYFMMTGTPLYGNAYCGNTWGVPRVGGQTWGAARTATIGFALDMDTRTLNWYKDGQLIGALCGNLPVSVRPFVAYGNATGDISQVDANFGQSEFKYPVPAGYNAGLW